MFSDWQEGEEELRVELEETVVDMLSEEEEDEEIDRADVGSDNDTDLDMEIDS
jgi:hypothetical protein